MVQKGILSIWQVHVTLSVSCQNLYFFLRVKVMMSQAQFKTLTSSNEWIKNGGMKLVSSFLTDSFNNLWHWTTSSVLDCMLEHSIVHVEINYAAYYCIMTHIQTAIVCNSLMETLNVVISNDVYLYLNWIFVCSYFNHEQ